MTSDNIAVNYNNNNNNNNNNNKDHLTMSGDSVVKPGVTIRKEKETINYNSTSRIMDEYRQIHRELLLEMRTQFVVECFFNSSILCDDYNTMRKKADWTLKFMSIYFQNDAKNMITQNGENKIKKM